MIVPREINSCAKAHQPRSLRLNALVAARRAWRRDDGHRRRTLVGRRQNVAVAIGRRLDHAMRVRKMIAAGVVLPRLIVRRTLAWRLLLWRCRLRVAADRRGQHRDHCRRRYVPQIRHGASLRTERLMPDQPCDRPLSCLGAVGEPAAAQSATGRTVASTSLPRRSRRIGISVLARSAVRRRWR